MTERDLWKDGVNMVESGKCLVANNLICPLNNFLGLRNHPVSNWEIKIKVPKKALLQMS